MIVYVRFLFYFETILRTVTDIQIYWICDQNRKASLRNCYANGS